MVTVRSVTVNLRADISNFERQLAAAAASARGFSSSLDDGLTRVNDKMGLLASSAVALGPALVPVAAAATVGIAALGTQLTFAATGAGVAVLALSGVAGALKALNTYSGAPTQANLTALQSKLSELAPAGQSFVFFLDNMRGKLDELKASAATGFLPGLQSGIQSVMTQFPIVNQLVSQLASTMGHLAEQGGAALQSPFWTHFLQDFSRNASVALTTMSEGLGNVAHGLAGVFDAFLPAGEQMSQKLLELSREFATWGQGLSSNTGFQRFMAYIEQAAPRVVSTLASLAKALLAIVEAAAPLGSSLLPVIKALADGLAAIANSPAGPAIFTVAAAITAVAKALALLKAVGIVGGLSGAIKGAAAVGAEGAAAGAAARAGATAAGGLSTGELAAGLGGSAALGVVGGFAAAALMPLYNGYALAAQGADKLSAAQQNLGTVFSGSTVSFRAQSSAIRELGGQVNSYWANQRRIRSEETSSWNPWTIIRDAGQGASSYLFGGDSKARSVEATQGQAMLQLQQWVGIAQRIRQGLSGANGLQPLRGLTSNQSTLQGVLDANLPALHQLGHSTADILQMGKTQTGMQELVDELKAYNQAAAESARPTDQFRAAIASLDNKMVSTTTAAQNIQSAFSGIVGPAMANVAATDAYRAGLAHLPAALSSTTKSLVGQTDGARQNRAAIDSLVTQFGAMISAGAAAGETAKQFTARMQAQYQALVQAGVAAGISRADMAAYLKTLGLTPKEVHTLIQLNSSAASGQLANYKAALEKLNGSIAVTTVETVFRNVGSASPPGGHNIIGGGINAYGNLYTFGLGGTLPAVGEQPSQMRSREQGALLWNENPHSPWEAFVSGDPAAWPRSRAITEQVADRLGGRVEWMADGGLIGQRVPSGPGAATGQLATQVAQLSRQVANMRQKGTQRFVLDIGGGKQLTGFVRDVARDEVDQAASYASDEASQSR